MQTMEIKPIEEIFKEIENFPFVESDGEPLETSWHRNCMNLLISATLWLFRDRDDFYVGGDMFIYFSPTRLMSKDFRGPDYFVVNGGVSWQPERKYWVSWFENSRLPDVVIELTSPTTEKVDRTAKFDLYEQTWRTRNYFIYDPTTKQLHGWELDSNRRYQPLTPNERGWLWCAELGVWVGVWEGEFNRNKATWLRFFDEQGRVVPTAEEAALRRADDEKRRADAAEAELARLRKTLGKPDEGNGSPAPTP
jgi:Uma2 family endonuclease